MVAEGDEMEEHQGGPRKGGRSRLRIYIEGDGCA